MHRPHSRSTPIIPLALTDEQKTGLQQRGMTIIAALLDRVEGPEFPLRAFILLLSVADPIVARTPRPGRLPCLPPPGCPSAPLIPTFGRLDI